VATRQLVRRALDDEGRAPERVKAGVVAVADALLPQRRQSRRQQPAPVGLPTSCAAAASALLWSGDTVAAHPVPEDEGRAPGRVWVGVDGGAVEGQRWRTAAAAIARRRAMRTVAGCRGVLAVSGPSRLPSPIPSHRLGRGGRAGEESSGRRRAMRADSGRSATEPAGGATGLISPPR
jgi:hypothetical protein